MASAPRKTNPPRDVPELYNGDHMTQKEFHRIYEQMPDNFRAELIGGIVYVASPLRRQHGVPHGLLTTVFGTYRLKTPGVEACDNATVILGPGEEVQPDLFLRIHPECGGQSRTTEDDYVDGAPELVAEIAASSVAIDLHTKRHDYAHYGVNEYLVLCVSERRLRWFDLRADRELAIDPDGVLRVHSFPGLWIDVAAVLDEHARLLTVLEEGLATPEHAAFVRQLARAKATGGGKRRQPSRRRRKSQD